MEHSLFFPYYTQLNVSKNEKIDLYHTWVDDIYSIQEIYNRENKKKVKYHKSMKSLPYIFFSLKRSVFVSENVQKQDIPYEQPVHCFEYKIHNIMCKIYFIQCHTNDVHSVVYYIHKVISILYKYKRNTNKIREMNIYMLFDREKKQFSMSMPILGANHVNSAVTQDDGEKKHIFIYREEEWKKVFIHECIHAFHLDFKFQISKQNIVDIKKIIPLESTFLFSESYAEVWATILYISIMVYDYYHPKDMVSYYRYNVFYVTNQQIYSMYKMIEILEYNSIEYTDLLERNMEQLKNYKEKTNVFMYYIVKCIILYDLNNFLEWCSDRNGIQIDNEKNITSYINLIEKNINNKKQQDDINYIIKNRKHLIPIRNSLRMTIPIKLNK